MCLENNSLVGSTIGMAVCMATTVFINICGLIHANYSIFRDVGVDLKKGITDKKE
jgi:hypothetical protein